MTQPPRPGILFAAAEHGSANVVLPVLRACPRTAPLGWVGLKPVRDRRLVFHRVARGPQGLTGLPWGRFGLCVTGSSSVYGLEREIWRRCGEHGIKSLCILDQHKDLSVRFGPGRTRRWPDHICVMNAAARLALFRLGAPAGSVSVTGSPYLGQTARSRLSAAQRRGLRRKLGLTGRRAISFCTEYIARAGQKARFGYDEHSVLTDIVAAIGKQPGPSRHVYIRLHPNDSPAGYRRYARKQSTSVRFHLVRRDPGNRILQACDLVIGMSSIILMEAAQLGLPVISYQPGSRPPFLYDATMRRCLVRTRDGLARRLNRILAGPMPRRARGPRREADSMRRLLTAMDRLQDARP